MSLFGGREWWGVTPGANEEFGGGSMAIGNFDNAADGAMKLATGSFAGLLRMYFPREAGFRVEDVMLEQVLDAPILQLAAGKFLSDSSRVTMAVLHPRMLAVYTISAVASQPNGKDASYYKVTMSYEHPLDRPACNFVHGPFGGTYGHELICVQSMDGQLTVIEQDRILYERKLGRFLLPGPLTYCTKGDFFLTYASRMEVECYKYATNVAGGAAAGAEGSGVARKLAPDWTLIVGEEVVSIQVGRFSRALAQSAVDILVVAAHTLVALKENGTIRMQKRIDYSPLCATSYPSGSSEPGAPEENVLIGTQGGVILVYRDMELLWSARLAHPAIALSVGDFGSVAGLIANLGHNGALALSYLGTDPPTSTIATETKELNYEAMDEEHRRLLQASFDHPHTRQRCPCPCLAFSHDRFAPCFLSGDTRRIVGCQGGAYR